MQYINCPLQEINQIRFKFTTLHTRGNFSLAVAVCDFYAGKQSVFKLTAMLQHI